MTNAYQRGPAHPLRVFVSYGHDEHASLAAKLRHDLQSRGHQVWFDQVNLRPGIDWEEHIDAGVEWLAEDREHARMLVLMTPHAVRRPDGYCLNEIARAVSKRIGIIPIMVAHCEPPLSICRIQHLDMSSCLPVDQKEPQYLQSLSMLLNAIEDNEMSGEGFDSRKRTTLEPIDFSAELSAHALFVGRDWIFESLDAWITAPGSPRVFVLVAPPGLGKSALAVELVHRSQRVIAFHMCAHSSQLKSDARRMVTSLAYQLSTQIPAYSDALSALDLDYVTQKYDAATLFDVLLTTPLSRIPAPDFTPVIVIDGLDEATSDGRNEVADFLGKQAGSLPDWVRLLVTTRPEPEVIGPLEGLGLHQIEPESHQNVADIRNYLSLELQELDIVHSAREHAIDTITRRSAGVMLYAQAACQLLRRDGVSEESLSALPDSLSAMYTRQLQSRFTSMASFGEQARPLLSMLLAGFEPLRFDLLCAALGQTRDDTSDAVGALGSLVVDDGDTITLYHKTIRDWLTNRRASRNFYVSDEMGHDLLAKAAKGWRRMPRQARQYLINFGPGHLLYSHDWPSLLEVLGEPLFQPGRDALFDDLLRDPERLDSALDLAEELVSAEAHDLIRELISRLEAAIEAGRWHAVEPITEVLDDHIDSHLSERLTFLRAWSFQLRGDLDESMRYYGALSDQVPDTDGHLAFRRADAIRESGGFDEAFTIYQSLAARTDVPGRLTILYSQQYADLLYVRGQYVDALAELDKTIASGDKDSPEVFGEALRIRGHIQRVLFDDVQALSDYSSARGIFREIGHRANLARIETNLAETFAWTDPDRAMWHADNAIRDNNRVGSSLEAGKALRAKGLALARLGRYDDATMALDEAERDLRDVGYAAGVCETQANRIILDVLRGSVDSVPQDIADLAIRLREINAYPLLIARSCAAYSLRGDLDETLLEIGRIATNAIQWPIDVDTYRRRLTDSLGLST